MNDFKAYLRFLGWVFTGIGVVVYFAVLLHEWERKMLFPVEDLEPLERWRQTGTLDGITAAVATLPPTKFDSWGRAVWDDEKREPKK